mgnify:FL=1
MFRSSDKIKVSKGYNKAISTTTSRVVEFTFYIIKKLVHLPYE